MATLTPKTTSIKAKSTCDAILTKKGCCGTAAVENGILFKNQPHTHPKIQMKSKRSKSSPK